MAPIPVGLEGSGAYLQPRGSRTVPTADEICRCGSRVCMVTYSLSGKLPEETVHSRVFRCYAAELANMSGNP
jgi:hypothetical protein